MIVKELIEALALANPNSEVYIPGEQDECGRYIERMAHCVILQDSCDNKLKITLV